MKLVLCLACQDVFKLSNTPRCCKCGLSSGYYQPDGLNAVYSGEKAIPIGFNNTSLAAAVATQPKDGMGQSFNAFVIPKKCPTFKKEQ